MPYTTRKGTGKDKGKTCVHKKSSKKKVGCTSGPIEKYLTALRMAESDDMDWIHSAGQNKILTINKLKELFKKNNIDVDWDIEYDRTEDGHGEYNEYFGKFYYDRENPISYNESYFIELYEKENGHLFFQLYRYDEEDDKYYRDEVYSQIETSSKNPEKFWRTVGWLVLYQMGKINPVRNGETKEETFDVENTIEESNELDWMKGPPSFRFGEISRDLRNYFSKGDKVYLTGILYLSEEKEDITLHLNHEPAVVKHIREDVGVLDLTLGKNITSLPIWTSAVGNPHLDLGSFNEDNDIKITIPSKNINESDDLDWIRDAPSNQKVRPWNGNIGYPDADKTSPTYGKVYLYTDDEGVTREIKVGGLTSKHRTKNYKGEWFGSDGEVSFYDASIMSSDIESKNYDPEYPDPFEGKYRITMSRQEYNDNARKGKLILTPNNNSTSSINESEEDFDWASGFTWYKEMLDNMLSDCKTLKLANFNIKNKQPYTSAGGPNIMFLSRCKEWWDYFGGIPLTNSGRGTAEWFTEDNYKDGEYGIIWNPGWARKKITPQLEDLEHGYTSAITTPWGYGIEKQLNGIHNGEAWFVVDENNKPVYDLIPEPVKGYAKIYEEFFGDRLNESDDFDWAKEIPGTKEYGQRYRYFEIIACYGVDYETEECDDEYSHHIRIPSDEVDEIWDIPYGDFDYLAGPGDEAEGVIMYAIKNRLISPGELNGIAMFQGVREEDDSHFDGIDEPQIFESNELDWIKDIEAKGFEKNKSYVVDVRHLKPYIPTSVSPTSEEYTKLTRTDVLDKLKRLGYNVDEISIDDADYLYIEPNDEAGYWDDTVWVNQTHWVDYDMEHNTPDLTYDGKYEIMDIDDLMFLLDNNMVNESTDFDWVKGTGLGKVDLRDCKPGDILVTRSGKTVEYVGPSDGYYDHEIKYKKNSYGTRTHDGYVFRKNRRDDDEDIIKVLGENKKSITEAAGISFEARKWGEIIYNEIMDNPNEKKRLIIDGYDHPEAFDGFPIDYVVIDFYDRLTGYGQEHSGYDKDGNYVVLLYIQPKLVQGQGGYDLRSVLNHEMKHAWEDYNRLSKGLPSVEQTKESQELYNRDFILMLSDQNIRGPIKEILKYYYYLSDLEKSAYLENVYDQNKVYERVLRDIAGKDFNEFKDRFDLDINWHLMNTAYDIPFLKKFKSPIDFIDYSAEELRSKALKMIKKVNKMKYIHKK